MARFHFDTYLITTLGNSYRSTEEALKELVANAWDADATTVEITLPEPMTTSPVIVSDNGYGMTSRELQTLFLQVGNNRRNERGERTPKGRTVRGARGIGKFAGLAVAQVMIVKSMSRGEQSTVTLDSLWLESQGQNLESVDFDIQTVPTAEVGGTYIELHGLRPSLSFPSAEKLSRVLLREFSRRDDFLLTINGKVLSANDLEGADEAIDLDFGSRTRGSGRVWILDKGAAVADPGVILRVQGRAIGNPTFFGLDADPTIPRSLLKRVYGEIEVDALVDDVQSNWSAFIENGEQYQALMEAGNQYLRTRLLQVRGQETGTRPQEFVESFRDEIDRLPPPRRELARKALYRIFDRFYDDALDRKEAIAEVFLLALETDEYWSLVQRIHEADLGDIIEIASVLEHWGIFEISGIVHRAHQRLKVLEHFEALISQPQTLELQGIHRALQNNLWILGDNYELLASNRTLRTVVNKLADQKYSGERAQLRPDLLIGDLPSSAHLPNRRVLVELKRPQYRLTRKDVSQALEYRDELLYSLPNSVFEVFVIGGSVDPVLRASPDTECTHLTFIEVLDRARQRLNWIVQHLDEGTDDTRLDTMPA